jgi:hypothetical protein
VGLESFVISIVPFTNKFRDDVIRCLRKVARQKVESIVGTLAWGHHDDVQIDCIDELPVPNEKRSLRLDLLHTTFSKGDIRTSGVATAREMIERVRRVS